MGRTGPNQDINDPTTIIDLAYNFQQLSNSYGDFFQQSQSQNPNTSGSPIVDISIPFEMSDGSTKLLQGSDIDYIDGYIYDSGLISNAHIGTYIYLAEIFRDYWETLNSVLDQLNDYDYLQEDDIDPEGPTIVDLMFGTRIHGSLGGIAYNNGSYSHSPPASFSIPIWDGVGPTDYNQLTYPQLLTQLQTLDLLQRNVSQKIWDTIYWYDKFSDADGDVKSVSAIFGKSREYVPPLNQQYVQIYNYGSGTIDIELYTTITATFYTRFSTSISSWAEIDDINSYPDPFGGFKYLLSSWMSETVEKLAPGGTTTLSNTRIIEIPPGKSAFIGGGAGAGTTFGIGGTVDITIVLNDKTLTHSVNVV